ncbi:MAG: hypothetical protein ACU83U_01940, partial [Gammaproteobacteria bacterium]
YTSPGPGCGFLAADFMPTAALLKRFHSLLCACFSALLSASKQLAIFNADFGQSKFQKEYRAS